MVAARRLDGIILGGRGAAALHAQRGRSAGAARQLSGSSRAGALSAAKAGSTWHRPAAGGPQLHSARTPRRTEPSTACPQPSAPPTASAPGSEHADLIAGAARSIGAGLVAAGAAPAAALLAAAVPAPAPGRAAIARAAAPVARPAAVVAALRQIRGIRPSLTRSKRRTGSKERFNTL